MLFHERPEREGRMRKQPSLVQWAKHFFGSFECLATGHLENIPENRRLPASADSSIWIQVIFPPL